MINIFLKLLNISFSASLLIAACIVIRYAFKGMPKYMRCVLWMLVLLRLACPLHLESRFSLLPKKDVVTYQEAAKPEANDEITADDVLKEDSSSGRTIKYIVGNLKVNKRDSSEAAQPEASKKSVDKDTIVMVLAILWIVGILISIIYGVTAYVRLIKCVDDAVLLDENVYQTERIATPFVLGIIRPRIYVPYNLSHTELYFVLNHERAHISRKDHMLKPAAYIISCIYWFNPLVWISYVLLCRDIELACDEKAINKIGYNKKKEYSQSILDLSVPRKIISACPVAFGETGVKERVKSVLNMKKGTKIAVIVSALLIVIVGVGFLTYPRSKEKIKKEQKAAAVTEAASGVNTESSEEIAKEVTEEVNSSEDIDKAKEDSDKEAVENNNSTEEEDGLNGLISSIINNPSMTADNLDIHVVASTSSDDKNAVLVYNNDVDSYSYSSEDVDVSEVDDLGEEAPEIVIKSSGDGAPDVKIENADNSEDGVVQVVVVDKECEEVAAPEEDEPYNIVAAAGIKTSAVIKEGDEIHSYVAGKVKSSGTDEEKGNYIEIEDAEGNVFSYYNMSEPSELKEGDAVTKGQIIGKIGKVSDGDGAQIKLSLVGKDGKRRNITIYTSDYYYEED